MTIKQQAHGDKRVEEELADGFWRLMGWQSPKTMEIYTHTLNKRAALLEVMLEEEEEEKRGQTCQDDLLQIFVNDQSSRKDTRAIPTTQSSYDDEDFSWYEE